MLKMLLVEEKTPFRVALYRLLQNHFPKAEIASANTCLEAEQRVALSVPDFIFINAHVGSEKGLDFVNRIKPKYSTIKFLVLADNDLPEYYVAAYRAGADFFLPKDQWSGEKMIALVETLLMEGAYDGR